jgi:histidyl-tRNA synthetase
MAKTTASIPQGTRDFGPEVVRKRTYILNIIKNIFELYGFQPLETPAMENIETLMGKYGEEGDKLIFKILNNGLDKKVETARTEFEKVLLGKNTAAITERALKYDLTIPFARYVAMNHSQLTFPFRRYQVQPVWRADRPQKGRYREFYQCDADVVGSYSLWNEVELAIIYATVFEKLGIDITLKINNRKILTALAELCGGVDKMNMIAIAIDKLDKIGLEKVKIELSERGLDASQVGSVEKYLSVQGTNEAILSGLKELLGSSSIGNEGIREVGYLLDNIHQPGTKIKIDPTLARGLNYYTGTIFEVTTDKVKIGSIGGGGRYDDLTGLFGVPDIPGVGISFGVDRIYDVMEELTLFPEEVHIGTQVLFFNLGEAESKRAFALMQELRAKGIRCELFHDNLKFDKQFKYAEKKNIPYVIIIGEKELKENTCNIKNLSTGNQVTVDSGKLGEFSFTI